MKVMKIIALAAALFVAACSVPQDGFVGAQSVRSPLYEPAKICKRFYYDARCHR